MTEPTKAEVEAAIAQAHAWYEQRVAGTKSRDVHNAAGWQYSDALHYWQFACGETGHVAGTETIDDLEPVYYRCRHCGQICVEPHSVSPVFYP
jgi:hypothetical protein